MKVMKFFGVLFVCLGCMAAFVGIAAAVLPMIQNEQLQLVLASFAAPAANPFVNAMNAAMTYALGNCYLVMLAGAGGALAGALLLLGASKNTPQPERSGSGREAPRTARPPVRQPAPGQARGETVPAWRPSKAEDAASRNPFAARMASDMMSYRAASRAAESAVPPAEPVITFAPAVQRQAAEAVPSPVPPRMETFMPSPYARPQPVTERSAYAPPEPEQTSPYARPQPVTTEPPIAPQSREESFAPLAYARPEPAAAEPPATPPPREESFAPLRYTPPAPEPEAAPPGEPYQPLFTEHGLWSSDALPDESAPARREPPTQTPAGDGRPSEKEAAPDVPPKSALPGGWATPAQAGWLSAKPGPASSAEGLVTPPPPLAAPKKEAPRTAPGKVRIKSTMGKHR